MRPAGPSRFLSIVRSESLYVRLVDSETLTGNIDYTALSHCWGGKVDIKLQTHNATRLSQGVPISELPATFRDAVIVTDRLGLDFLWIDALCIQQDSKEDWLAEAPKMANVYSQASVNLAATAGADSSVGLFCQQPDCIADLNVLETSWRGLPQALQTILVRAPYEKSWFQHINGGILNTRGWVFQERILSPRTLHFAQDEISWHCKQSVGTELFESPLHNSLLLKDDPRSSIDRKRWSDLVRDYSNLSLSVPSDKLVAIAGIARFFGQYHQLSESDYMAGIWRSSAYDDMLWYTHEPRAKPDVVRAPSWSWASVDSAVNFGPHVHKDFWRLWEFETDHLLRDQFASAGNSKIRLQCSLLPLKDVVYTGNGPRRAKKIKVNDGWVELEDYQDWSEIISFLALDHSCQDDGVILEGAWFIPMAVHGVELEVLRKGLRGLLVRKLPRRTGTFRRIGFLQIAMLASTWNEEKWKKCKLTDVEMFKWDCENGQYEIVLE